MKKSYKHLIHQTALLVGIIIGIVFLLVLIVPFVVRKVQANAKPPAENKVANELARLNTAYRQQYSSIPVRLTIPKISVDATVEQMGVTISNLLEAPTGPHTVGWYKYGPKPGEVGSAVIDGHYGRWADGEGSVFDNLNTLKPGDVVVVTDEKGVATSFVVRELKTYDPKANDTAVFQSPDGLAHLNLITCDGSFNATSQNYSRRLVVFTDKK